MEITKNIFNNKIQKLIDNKKYAEAIKEIETKNMDLIIAQNKQLVKYTKKLKGYLLKSYMAIEEVSKLKQENCKLKEENKKLKEKNQNLTNYIEKTFEVVKYLFNFPIERFKRLVYNFVRNK